VYVFYNLTWILVSLSQRIYNENRFEASENIVTKFIKAIFLHVLIMFAIVFTLKLYFFSRYFALYFYEIYFILAIIFRILLIPLQKLYRKKGFNFLRTIIIGAGPLGIDVMKAVTSDLSIGLKFLGFFDDNPEKCVYKNKILGKIEEAKTYALEHKVDEVIVALPDFAEEKVKELIKFCEFNLIRIKIVPDFYRYFSNRVYIDFFGSIPFLYMREEPLQGYKNRLLKRAFDILFSLLIILLIFPWLIPVIIFLIKIDSKGPAFFVQERSGLNNKIFRMIKFRTMYINQESELLQATKYDTRITKIGRFLRQSNFDELPQFFNILMGQMSVVGPRPHMLKHTQVYCRIIENYMVRHFVKPGLTGWAQVSGYRGETGKPELMARRVEKDIWYIENWTFFLDLKIILKTIWNMVIGDKNAV